MITRNNYEEFFLLYVDNELSPADRQAVENFVDEHPDLKEEWELLLQCRISPDELPSLPGKELLLKLEDNDSPLLQGIGTPLIDTGNYESWFLSYVDDELAPASRQAVIDFVRQHPEKSIELQQLQRTVNIPDPAIVFPDKDLLYRREEYRAAARSGKVVWLPFARLAVAALVLGAIGLLIFHPFRKDQHLAVSTGNGHATTDTNTSTAAERPASGPSTVSPGPDAPATAATAHSGTTVAGTDTGSSDRTARTHITPAPAIGKKYIAAVTRHAPDPLYISKNGDRKQKASDTRTGTAPAEPTLVKVDPADPAKTIGTDPGHDLAVVDPKTIDRTTKLPVTLGGSKDQTQQPATGNINASFATQALLSQASYTDDGYGEEPSPRKNKLRGIFRKVTRVLEKSASREDDDNKKVTIGGFQFALK